MEDKWRIALTLFVVVFLLLMYLLFGVGGSIAGYLLLGCLLVYISGPGLLSSTSIKILFLWFPAIWSDRVRDWCIKDE